MNKCDIHRIALEAWDDFDRFVVLLADEIEISVPNQPKYEKAVQHVQECKHCQLWLNSKVPEEIKLRWDRMKKYCCTGMFTAVEGPHDDDELQVGLINFQGDPAWCVRNFDIAGGNLLFAFCPWCGSKMPDKPFVE